MFFQNPLNCDEGKSQTAKDRDGQVETVNVDYCFSELE